MAKDHPANGKARPVLPQQYRIHVDVSFDSESRMGKLAWVVYLQDELVSSNVLPKVRAGSANALEKLVFKIINQIYAGAKIYTDSVSVWQEWKGKNKNRIYLIDSDDNLADALLKGRDVPARYRKVPTYRFEYVRVRDGPASQDC